jgi:pyridoxine 5-phosphate synthase
LKEVIEEFHRNSIRTSIFVGTDVELVEGAAQTGTERVELYTEPYANKFSYG